MNQKKNKLCLLWLPVLLVAIDQVTKFAVRKWLEPKEYITIIGKSVTFRYVENRGAVWGIFQGKVDILSIVTVFMIALILLLIARIPSGKRFRPMLITMIVLFSGAFGNLIDRIFFHFVTDFISFDIINFPVFNVADIYVTCSAFVLLFLFCFYYKEEELSFLPFFGSEKKSETDDTNATENGQSDSSR